MNRRTHTFKERFTVTSEYARGTVHNVYAKVVISVTPAPSFSFGSEVVWPHESFEGAIREGIRSVLREAGVDVGIGAEFMLEQIGWRDAESCWDSYYQAARMATAEILKRILRAPEGNGGA